MLSDYGENLLTNLLSGQATIPATLYIALMSSQPDPTDTGSDLTEPAVGAYARVSVAMSSAAWTVATDGVSRNVAPLTFPQATADWGFLTHYAFCTAATAGQWLWSSALLTPTAISTGYQFYIPIAGASISIQGSTG